MGSSLTFIISSAPLTIISALLLKCLASMTVIGVIGANQLHAIPGSVESMNYEYRRG